MFKRLTDEYGYARGWIITIPGIFMLLKYQANKIMDKEDHIMVMRICGKEVILK
jgi:hypothetical protein